MISENSLRNSGTEGQHAVHPRWPHLRLLACLLLFTAAITQGREKKDVVLQMANGQKITRSVGFAIIRTDKFFTVDEVIFAESDDLLLLGARTLEGFNARVDNKQKKLVAAGPLVAAGNQK